MKKWICFAALVLLLPGCLGLCEVVPDVFAPSLYEGNLAVWFFSLPGTEHTGESMLIRSPEGQCMLIDGGAKQAGEMINAYLDRIGIGDLDAMLATHMHVDHIGGLPAVLARHGVKVLYSSPFTEYHTNPAAALKAAAAERGLALTPLLAGESFSLGSARAEVLAPFTAPVPRNDHAITGDFLNDSSVVFRLTYGEISFLFPGDATRNVEWELVERYGEQLRANVIKVPHHGSADASSRVFVQAVCAQESVMCIYAFNDFSIYERYQKTGGRPWVTSLDGTVLCVTDGSEVTFYTEKERQGMLK